MKPNHFRLGHLTSAIIVSFINSTVYAGAFHAFELGTPIIGTAGVGQAAVANDASTSYFNPAGMAQLNSTQYMLGSQVISPLTNFSIGGQNTLSGDNGGSAGILTPGVSLFYAYSYSPKLKLGVSFTSPYGGELNYTNGWAGRYSVQNMTFYTLDLNPAISYSINPLLAVGAGMTVEYASLQQSLAIPVPIAKTIIDGQANIKVSSFEPGFNVGVFLTPSATTKIGIAYRSQIVHNLHGNTTFLRIPAQPQTTTTMTMPQNVIVSLDQAITNRVNLLGELGWENWKTMRSSVVNIADYTVATPQNWSDTYRLGVGAQFHATSRLTLQAGSSYDSSPTKSTLRTPNLPGDKQLRLATGIMYSPSQSIKLGFSYEYLNFGKAPIDNILPVGTLQGNYSSNYANVFQASVNVTC